MRSHNITSSSTVFRIRTARCIKNSTGIQTQGSPPGLHSLWSTTCIWHASHGYTHSSNSNTLPQGHKSCGHEQPLCADVWSELVASLSARATYAAPQQPQAGPPSGYYNPHGAPSHQVRLLWKVQGLQKH